VRFAPAQVIRHDLAESFGKQSFVETCDCGVNIFFPGRNTALLVFVIAHEAPKILIAFAFIPNFGAHRGTSQDLNRQLYQYAAIQVGAEKERAHKTHPPAGRCAQHLRKKTER
jgi:hypothetical protein